MSASQNGTPAVVAEGVEKRFRVPHERRHTLKERVLHPFSRMSFDRLEALKGVSFSVRRGEFFGIVGRNGSGKSTLLKCMAGIYRLDGGELYVDGRISPFIELGVGFNPNLAARDNVMVNGVMLGLSPREALRRYDAVMDFAELRGFEDMLLKNYSSGMHVRLAFSVMIQMDADVLLVDEILAVGDAAFQQKCFEVFYRMREEGKTVIFVTHDMAAVERFCHRALLLERGALDTIGDPKAVAERYLEINLRTATPETSEVSSLRAGDGAGRLVAAHIEDEEGSPQQLLHQDHRYVFEGQVRFERAVEDPVFAVTFVNARLQNVFIASSDVSRVPTGRFDAGESATFRVEFENVLAPGRYFISTVLAHSSGGQMDTWEQFMSFIVDGSRGAGGIVDLPHRFELERGPVGSRARA